MQQICWCLYHVLPEAQVLLHMSVSPVHWLICANLVHATGAYTIVQLYSSALRSTDVCVTVAL